MKQFYAAAVPMPSRRGFLARSVGLVASAAAPAALLRGQNKSAWVGTREVILSNTSNPAMGSKLTTGDNYIYTVLGPANAAVSACTQINGGSWYCSAEGTAN